MTRADWDEGQWRVTLPPLDARLVALLLEIPPEGTPWPKAARDDWHRRFGAALDAIYEG
jgi:hypothetical protein